MYDLGECSMGKLEEVHVVLCDTNMPVKLNGKIQDSGKTSGAETWSTMKSQKKICVESCRKIQSETNM